MASPTADIRHRLKVPANLLRPRGGATQAAAFAPTLALVVVIALAGFGTLMALVLLVNHPSPLPPPFPAQNQDAETLLYVLAFVLVLPLALLSGTRVADRIAASPGAAGLSALVGALAGALAAAFLLVKLSTTLPWTDGVGTVLVATLVWWLVASVALRRAADPRGWPALLRLADHEVAIWVLTGVLLLGDLLCLTVLSSVSPVGAAVGVLVGALLFIASERLRVPAPPRLWRVAIDVAVVVLVLLAVPDLVVVSPEQAAGNLSVSFQNAIIQFHQNFLLGPANEVLSGRTMLVDTASQYGVGSIYLLAGWFNLAPIGYGTLGFLSGALSALIFAAGYGVMRVARTPRTIAVTTLLIAVIALVFNLPFPIDSIPQDSAIRFGLPVAALLAMVVADRWPPIRRTATPAVFLVVGVSSIWSLEGFAYTVATFGAIVCLLSWLREPGGRLRWLGRQAALAAGVCLSLHLLFAAATLAASGELPDWGQYLAYLRAFLFGHLGDLTFDYARWSSGLALGAAYLASTAAIVLLANRRPDFVRGERTSMLALVGMTAYGAAIYSYYNNRSTGNTLINVALPGLIMGGLWLGLLMRSRSTASPALRRGGLAFTLSVAVILLAVAWSSIGERYPRSAVAYAVPGGTSLRGALHRLWHLPALSSLTPEGERLLARYMPGNGRALVVTTPDLAIEILFRSQRGNVLPLAAPWQDSFVDSVRLPALRKAVDGIRPGERMLLDDGARKEFFRLRRHPSVDPLTESSSPGTLAPASGGALAPLQSWALKRIGRRFDLRTIHNDGSGLVAVELVPRRQG